MEVIDAIALIFLIFYSNSRRRPFHFHRESRRSILLEVKTLDFRGQQRASGGEGRTKGHDALIREPEEAMAPGGGGGGGGEHGCTVQSDPPATGRLGRAEDAPPHPPPPPPFPATDVSLEVCSPRLPSSDLESNKREPKRAVSSVCR
jgi:hypothetical protein